MRSYHVDTEEVAYTDTTTGVVYGQPVAIQTAAAEANAVNGSNAGGSGSAAPSETQASSANVVKATGIVGFITMLVALMGALATI